MNKRRGLKGNGTYIEKVENILPTITEQQVRLSRGDKSPTRLEIPAFL